MRGVSAIIATILILMITVSLAAMAYVFFTQTFGQVTGGAGNLTSSQMQAMATAFSLETAYNMTSSTVNVVLRNTGTADIDMSKVAVYISSKPATITGRSSTTLNPGNTGNINVSATAADCNKELDVTLATVTAPQTITITCA